ncbi:MAG: stress response translation initiation inhibitor YciH [Desulfurococcales archaeon]
MESICGGLPPEICKQLVAEQQLVKIRIEKRKFGKEVTIIEGLDETQDLRKIASMLKSKLATGGTAKNGRIELQGDHRHKVKNILIKELGIPEENIIMIEEGEEEA